MDRESTRASDSDRSLPDASQAAEALPDRSSAFFSALLTEHFVLESARGITVSESGTRAALNLTTLSASLIAFGFLSDTDLAAGYLAAIIPVNLVLGVITFERLLQTALEDVVALVSIQRIRRFYGTLLPGAERFFPTPRGRPAPNEMLDLGRMASWRGVFFTISSAIAVVNSVVAGSGAALLLSLLGLPNWTSALLGALGAGVIALSHGIYQVRRFAHLSRVIEQSETR
jgi:hypothetical protein